MRGDDCVARLRAGGAHQGAEKLAALIARENAASDAYGAAAMRLQNARDVMKRAAAKLRSYEQLPEAHPYLRTTVSRAFEPDAERRVALVGEDRERALRPHRAELESAETEVRTLEAEAEAIKSSHGFIASRLCRWIRDEVPPSTVLRPFGGSVELPDDEPNPKTAIDKLRERLPALDAEARKVLSAPYPLAVIRQQVRSYVETMAARGCPDLLRTAELGLAPAPPVLAVPVPGSPVAINIPDSLGVVFWAFRDVLLDKLLAEAEAIADDESDALTEQQRRDMAADIAARKLALERAEEELITRAENDGVILARRPDCDPRAVLVLDDTVVAPVH